MLSYQIYVHLENRRTFQPQIIDDFPAVWNYGKLSAKFLVSSVKDIDTVGFLSFLYVLLEQLSKFLLIVEFFGRFIAGDVLFCLCAIFARRVGRLIALQFHIARSFIRPVSFSFRCLSVQS